jgi:hypothetical protein
MKRISVVGARTDTFTEKALFLGFGLGKRKMCKVFCPIKISPSLFYFQAITSPRQINLTNLFAYLFGGTQEIDYRSLEILSHLIEFTL